MGEQTIGRWVPRWQAMPAMTEGFLRTAYQTRKSAVDAAQRHLDDLRAEAIKDGLADVVRELDGAREGESS
jgi:hypothetical protein